MFQFKDRLTHHRFGPTFSSVDAAETYRSKVLVGKARRHGQAVEYWSDAELVVL